MASSSNQPARKNHDGIAWDRWLLPGLLSILLSSAAGCSGDSGHIATLQSPAAHPTDVAVRLTPVVPGRRARVFIFTAVGDTCERLPAPVITVMQPPAKGDISFVPGQETTIQDSAKGTCVGTKATGTGVYYTARAGMEGNDRFAVSAKLQSGETFVRSFEVTIAE